MAWPPATASFYHWPLTQTRHWKGCETSYEQAMSRKFSTCWLKSKEKKKRKNHTVEDISSHWAVSDFYTGVSAYRGILDFSSESPPFFQSVHSASIWWVFRPVVWGLQTARTIKQRLQTAHCPNSSAWIGSLTPFWQRWSQLWVNLHGRSRCCVDRPFWGCIWGRCTRSSRWKPIHPVTYYCSLIDWV